MAATKTGPLHEQIRTPRLHRLQQAVGTEMCRMAVEGVSGSTSHRAEPNVEETGLKFKENKARLEFIAINMAERCQLC